MIDPFEMREFSAFIEDAKAGTTHPAAIKVFNEWKSGRGLRERIDETLNLVPELVRMHEPQEPFSISADAWNKLVDSMSAIRSTLIGPDDLVDERSLVEPFIKYHTIPR